MPRQGALDLARGVAVAGMVVVDDWGLVDGASTLAHAPWNGATLADMVMPLFLACTGASLRLASRRKGPGPLWRAALKSARLFAVGVLMQGGQVLDGSPESFELGLWDVLGHLRVCGILNRIAVTQVAVLAAVTLLPRERHQAALFGGVLAATTALVLFLWVPSWVDQATGAVVRCDVRGHLASPACAAAGMVDRAVLGQRHLHKWFSLRMLECSACAPAYCPREDAASWCFARMYDPEGIVSTVASTASVWLGFWLGGPLLDDTGPSRARCGALFVRGACLVAAGMALRAMGLPLNKQLGSASFVLLSSGVAAWVFAAAHLAERIPQLGPLRDLGMNAFAAYVVNAVLQAGAALLLPAPSFPGVPLYVVSDANARLPMLALLASKMALLVWLCKALAARGTVLAP